MIDRRRVTILGFWLMTIPLMVGTGWLAMSIIASAIEIAMQQTSEMLLLLLLSISFVTGVILLIIGDEG